MLRILYGLLAADILLTLVMQFWGGIFTMTVLLAGTSPIAPAWMLAVELSLGLAFLYRQHWAVGISLAMALILAQELYVASAINAVSILSLSFQAAHVVIFTLISAVAIFAWKEMEE